MATPDTIAPKSRRFSLRLPRPLWIGLASVVLVVCAWAASALWQASAVATIRRLEGRVGYASNSQVMEMSNPGHFDIRRYAGFFDTDDDPDSEDVRELLSGVVHRPFIADLWDHPLAVEIHERSLDLEAVGAIGRLRGLHYLAVDGCQFDRQAFGRSLRRLPSLQWLMLSDSSVDDDLLKAVAGMPHLGWLELNNTGVTDAGLSALANLRELRFLRLSRTHVAGTGLASLKSLTALKELELNETDVGDAGLGWLEDLEALERLELKRTRITDAGIDDVVKIRGLQRLWLQDTQVTPATLVKLATLPELRLLVVSDTGIDEPDLELFSEKRKSLGLPQVMLICKFRPM
jgi:hypothetical protein